MSTRTSLFYLEMAEKNKVKVTYPHKKRNKTPKFVHFLTYKFLVSRTVWTLESQLKTWEAYFIKWTTSGEPLISLRRHQGSKWGHSWVILYFTNWLPPCISGIFGQKKQSFWLIGLMMKKAKNTWKCVGDLVWEEGGWRWWTGGIASCFGEEWQWRLLRWLRRKVQWHNVPCDKLFILGI